MNNSLKIKLASILIGIYGLSVLINALIYYFILLPGETDIFRAVIRTIGSFIVAYYLYQRNKAVYWIALVGSILLVILGILGIFLLSISLGYTHALLVNFVFIVLLGIIFITLVPKEVRMEFK